LFISRDRVPLLLPIYW